MWVKQRHRPPICEWFVVIYTTYKNGDDSWVVYGTVLPTLTTGWGSPVISWFINHYEPHKL
jgi:hypothetical protein